MNVVGNNRFKKSLSFKTLLGKFFKYIYFSYSLIKFSRIPLVVDDSSSVDHLLIPTLHTNTDSEAGGHGDGLPDVGGWNYHDHQLSPQGSRGDEFCEGKTEESSSC